MRHVFVLEGQPLNQQPRVSLAGKGGALTWFALPVFKPSSANSCFPHNHTQLLVFRPPSHHQRHDWAELPPPEQRGTPRVLCHRQPGHLSRSIYALRRRAFGYLAPPELGVGLMEPWERVGAAGRRRAAFVHRDPRPEPWRPATARSLPQSAGARLRNAVKAARPEPPYRPTFRCHRDDLRPWGPGGGRRASGGRRSRCYGNHVSGSGCAGGTGLAGCTGRLTPARVFAGHPGAGYDARVPVRPRSRRTAEARGPGAQMAAFTRGARAFRRKRG